MYQILQHVLETRKGSDKLKMSLLFGNQHPGDILLRPELESMAAQQPHQFKLTMTVDRLEKDEKWSGFMGFVNEEMITQSIPSPSNDLLIFICGPPPMVKSVESILLGLGYSKDRIFAF